MHRHRAALMDGGGTEGVAHPGHGGGVEGLDRALARLEMMAREKGSVVGYATALPGSIARIAAWAKTLESRGIALVPITMVVTKARSS